MGHWVVPILVILLGEMFDTVVTCVEGVTLKNLKIKVKVNELMVY